MDRKSIFALLSVVAVAAILPSCGGVINLPTPSITSLSPSSTTAGGVGFTLTVNGHGFAPPPSSAVLWNGSAITTIFINEQELTAAIPPSLIASPGTIPVSVMNSTPGGGTSNVVNFTINPATSQVPTITSISPTGVLAGTSPPTLIVNGTNFVSQSVMTVNGNNRTTSVLSGTQLEATLLTSDISAAGNLEIAVLNPPPGGGLSNPVILSVTNPIPSLSTLSPTTVVVGSTGSSNTTLTVNGSGMDAASMVSLNGSPRATTFVNNSQVTAALTTNDLVAAQTFVVQVMNPSPGGGVSNTLPFSVIPTSTGTGLPELVDLSTGGALANNGIGDVSSPGPVIGGSTSRFIAFASDSTNLVASDTNSASDVFLRDTCMGTTSGCTPGTTLLSVASGGVQANGPSSEPSMSSSGQVVAFSSLATNLVTSVALTGSTSQIFLSTSCAGIQGCTPGVALVSISADGMSAADSNAAQPAVSPDGRFIAFVSDATNLVTGVTPAPGVAQIFVRDTCAGSSGRLVCTPATYLISSPTPGESMPALANGASFQPVVTDSTAGQFIAFTSTASNLGPSNPSNAQEVFLARACIGITAGCTPSVALISSSDGTTPGNGSSGEPSMDSTGRFVAFASTATNIVKAASTGTQQIFVRDACTGVSSGCMPATSLVSIADDGVSPGNALSEQPRLNSTGQFIVFASSASNLVATNTNGLENVFVRNTCATATTSCTPSTALASAVNSASGAPTPANGKSLHPAISQDGHFVTFLSFATNLVSNDTNVGLEDVFLAITTF